MNTIKRIAAAALLLAFSLGGQTLADLLPQYITALENITRILVEVKDVSSAKAAAPNLDSAVNQLLAVKLKLEQTRPNQSDARDAGAARQDGQKLQQAGQKLHEEIRRVRSLPKARKELAEILVKLK
jgi:flagellar biosynthesis/type III secretory pathway chaperone